MDRKIIICTNCGYENNPGHVFCVKCGERIDYETATVKTYKDWSFLIPAFKGIITTIVIVLVFAVALSFFPVGKGAGKRGMGPHVRMFRENIEQLTEAISNKTHTVVTISEEQLNGFTSFMVRESRSKANAEIEIPHYVQSINYDIRKDDLDITVIIKKMPVTQGFMLRVVPIAAPNKAVTFKIRAAYIGFMPLPGLVRGFLVKEMAASLSGFEKYYRMLDHAATIKLGADNMRIETGGRIVEQP